MPGKRIVTASAAILSAAVAACDPDAAMDPGKRAQPRPEGRPPAQWYAARPHVLRAALDEDRGRIWALHPEGVDAYDAASAAKLASVSLPEWTWAGEPYACPPGIAVGPGGDVFVTSNVVPVIWRVHSGDFQVTRHRLAVDEDAGKEVGFSGLAYVPPQGAFFAVSGLDGSLWRVDASLARALRIPLSAAMPKACGITVQPDGLLVHNELGQWMVHLTPDQRSGDARPALMPR